jgi:hypothetical protein
MGIIRQRFSPANKVPAPRWLARLIGSQSGYIDPIGSAIQFFGLGLTLWLIYLFFVVVPGQQTGLLMQRGIFTLLLITFILEIVLSRLAKKIDN